MKELDVIFESFFKKYPAEIEAGKWPLLEDLLIQEDDVLFDWVSNRNLPDNPALIELIKILKKVT